MRQSAIDTIGLAGFCALVYGIWQLSEPAALIIGGFLVMAGAGMASRGARR